MQKGKDNFLLSNNNLFEIKEDKKLIRHEIFKDNSENDKLNNFDELLKTKYVDPRHSGLK